MNLSGVRENRSDGYGTDNSRMIQQSEKELKLEPYFCCSRHYHIDCH